MRHFAILLSWMLLIGCSHKEKQADFMTPRFTNQVIQAHTPVQNQGSTSACWAFASASLIESELLQTEGDSVSLSVMYMVRQKYLNQFEAYYYSNGREEIRNGSLGHSFLRIWQEDGLMPAEAYSGLKNEKRHNHKELLRQLKKLAKESVKKRQPAEGRKKAIELLDNHLGAIPETFTYQGENHTPQSFAASLNLHPEDYIQLTSFSHHPFHTSYILEVPDNWEHASFYNVSLDELEQAIHRALAMGKTVAWDGDISEDCFSARKGLAIWPDSVVTQEYRQQGYESFTTTDDHMMHIVGLAHDEKGACYYILKNSWGRVGPYQGLLYMSATYLRAKTISILLHRDATIATSGKRN